MHIPFYICTVWVFPCHTSISKTSLIHVQALTEPPYTRNVSSPFVCPGPPPLSLWSALHINMHLYNIQCLEWRCMLKTDTEKHSHLSGKSDTHTNGTCRYYYRNSYFQEQWEGYTDFVVFGVWIL